ncbi:hypothetical protein VTN77DRAFT_1528 [Rasamsonia byssochlamydoides]|uniref:uncharacterized protein n=1 Tax=Rasamsonia byssochlamydoides TaxID=89139 RepID=UPI0037441924
MTYRVSCYNTIYSWAMLESYWRHRVWLLRGVILETRDLERELIAGVDWESLCVQLKRLLEESYGMLNR